MAIGIIGGALAAICHLFVGIAMHRKADNVTRFSTTACRPARGTGLLAGLAFPWVFLFAPMWPRSVAEARLASAPPGSRPAAGAPIVQLRALRQHHLQRLAGSHRGGYLRPAAHLLDAAAGPELEEAALQHRRPAGQITRHVTVLLSRHGLDWPWLLGMFLILSASISTGVYLLSPGTETIGSMLVSLWAAGLSISSRRSPLSIFC